MDACTCVCGRTVNPLCRGAGREGGGGEEGGEEGETRLIPLSTEDSGRQVEIG